MDIIGFENYLIYSDGRVYSKINNIFIKQTIGTTGYYYVSLYKHDNWMKSSKKYKVHRLIAIHYIPNPNNEPAVDHKDRNKLNNDISNLRWVTDKENMKNTGKPITNTSGHKNISYDNTHQKWLFRKRINNKFKCKTFKSKTACLCYKFIMILKLKPQIPTTILPLK